MFTPPCVFSCTGVRLLADLYHVPQGNGFTISVQLGLHTHRISCVVASIVTYVRYFIYSKRMDVSTPS